MAVVTSALIAAAVTAASAAAAGLSTYAIIGLAVASFAMNQYQASAQRRAEKKMRRSLSSLDEGRNQSVRQSIEPREIVYGVVRKGGF